MLGVRIRDPNLRELQDNYFSFGLYDYGFDSLKSN